MAGSGSGRTGLCERERKSCTGLAGKARSAGIVMARTVAGFCGGMDTDRYD